MAEKEKIEHKNLVAALAAFQGENPELKRTKEFGKATDKMHFWYTPLDEMLQTLRPLTSKHGLAIVYEESSKIENGLVCALYHESYAIVDGKEIGVVRSMAIKVKREGDMKVVGSDSTYARRYTAAEVLGVAPDEDNDVEVSEQRAANVEKFAIGNVRKGILECPYNDLANKLSFLQKELKITESGKAASLGLTKEQYSEVIALVEKRISDEFPAAPGNAENGNGVVNQPE